MEESKVLIWKGLQDRLLQKPRQSCFGWLTGVTTQERVALLSSLESLEEEEQNLSDPKRSEATLGRVSGFTLQKAIEDSVNA